MLTREERSQATADAILDARWLGGLERGIEQGIEQGLERGKREAALEVAKAALAKGIDLETIQEITGLDEKTLRQL